MYFTKLILHLAHVDFLVIFVADCLYTTTDLAFGEILRSRKSIIIVKHARSQRESKRSEAGRKGIQGVSLGL